MRALSQDATDHRLWTNCFTLWLIVFGLLIEIVRMLGLESVVGDISKD